MITAITTCMGRRDHLEITLPIMLEEFSRVIVVDWSCPQKSGEFAASLGASVVYKYGEKFFNISKARNLGATLADSQYLCFIDADNMCSPGFRAELESILNPGNMVLAARTQDGYDVNDLMGFIAMPTEVFKLVGGYDESWQDWGPEDVHLRAKLFLEEKLSVKRLSGMALGALAHTNEERSTYYTMGAAESAAIAARRLRAYFLECGISDWLTDPRVEPISHRLRPQ